MLYVGMLFSWFAWHVEDHELHSINYLHIGAPKTWYVVPGDAAPALEEVVLVYGYGSSTDSKAAFTLLGEKTTVMSPEVLLATGAPCCRLVQNAGDFVVTFSRSYHLGFSHGCTHQPTWPSLMGMYMSFKISVTEMRKVLKQQPLAKW